MTELLTNADSGNKGNLLGMLNKIADKKSVNDFDEDMKTKSQDTYAKSIYLAMLEYDPESFVSCGDGTVTSKYFKDGVVLGSKFAPNDKIEVYDNEFRVGLYKNALVDIETASDIWCLHENTNYSLEFLHALIDTHYYFYNDNPIRRKIKDALDNYIVDAPTYGLEWTDKIINAVEKKIYRAVREKMLRHIVPQYYRYGRLEPSYRRYVEEIYGVTDSKVLDIITNGLLTKQKYYSDRPFNNEYINKAKPKSYGDGYDRSLSWVLSTEGFYHKAFHGKGRIIYRRNGGHLGLYDIPIIYRLSDMIDFHIKPNGIKDDFDLELYNKLSHWSKEEIIIEEPETYKFHWPNTHECSFEQGVMTYRLYKDYEWIKKTNIWINAIKPGGIVEQHSHMLPFNAELFLKTVRQFIENEFGSYVYSGVGSRDTALLIRWQWVAYCDKNGYDSNYFGFKPALKL